MRTEDLIEDFLQPPFSRKHFRCRAGHVDVVVGLAPFDGQVPAGKVGEDFAVGSTRKHAGHANRACAGAAGEGNTTATLPGAHGYFAARVDLGPVGVDAAGKGFVMLDEGAKNGQWDGGDILDESNGVWIAHRDESCLQYCLNLISVLSSVDPLVDGCWTTYSIDV